MKYVKLFENFKEEYFFLRVTKTPELDLKRNFSCHAGYWTDDYEWAINWQKRHGAIDKPKQDPQTKSWCYDPEAGISSFGFNNEEDYKFYSNRIKDYIHGNDDELYVFKSGDYNLGSGLDGEDVFRNGKLVGKIDFEILGGDNYDYSTDYEHYGIKIKQSYSDILKMDE